MPIWSDIATWRGPTPNTSGHVTDHMYVVLHTADGSFEGTIAWQQNHAARVSSHFIVAKDGRIAQMLDTDAKPWTQIAGNPYSISIENEGNENTPLTPQQIEANARILAKAHQVHGIPLQLTGKVGTRGLGHHSMGAESGVDWGHSQCPGNIIKGQKAQVLARAIQIVGGTPTPAPRPAPTPESAPAMTGDDDMFLIRSGTDPAVYLADNRGHKAHINQELLDYLRAHGMPYYDGINPAYAQTLMTFGVDPAPTRTP